MNNTHMITVTGRQRLGAASASQQFRAAARLLQKDGSLLLTYDEIGEDNRKTHVSLKLADHRAVMIRSGAAQTRMEFDPNRITGCSYDTGAGILPLEIRTQDVSHQIRSADQRICLRYTLYYSGDVLSENEVTIRLVPIVP